jgi:hypothetical protein
MMIWNDWQVQGQHDREKAREDGWADLLLNGGGSPRYKPPCAPEDRKLYDDGWNNA